MRRRCSTLADSLEAQQDAAQRLLLERQQETMVTMVRAASFEVGFGIIDMPGIARIWIYVCVFCVILCVHYIFVYYMFQ